MDNTKPEIYFFYVTEQMVQDFPIKVDVSAVKDGYDLTDPQSTGVGTLFVGSADFGCPKVSNLV